MQALLSVAFPSGRLSSKAGARLEPGHPDDTWRDRASAPCARAPYVPALLLKHARRDEARESRQPRHRRKCACSRDAYDLYRSFRRAPNQADPPRTTSARFTYVSGRHARRRTHSSTAYFEDFGRDGARGLKGVDRLARASGRSPSSSSHDRSSTADSPRASEGAACGQSELGADGADPLRALLHTPTRATCSRVRVRAVAEQTGTVLPVAVQEKGSRSGPGWVCRANRGSHARQLRSEGAQRRADAFLLERCGATLASSSAFAPVSFTTFATHDLASRTPAAAASPDRVEAFSPAARARPALDRSVTRRSASARSRRVPRQEHRPSVVLDAGDPASGRSHVG